MKRNINRDKEVNKILEEQGWFVFRFWASDIEKNLPTVVANIISAISNKG